MENSTASASPLSIAPPVSEEKTDVLDYAPRFTRDDLKCKLLRAWTISRAIAWHLAPIVVLYAYFWFGYHFLLDHRYQINPDGVGYISVAQKYAAGQFFDAVNAYWSPLYSWLLVPLLKMGIEPLLASKILGLLIGAATIIAMWRLARFTGIPRVAAMVICAAGIPLIVDAAYMVITPDLLIACAILFYIASFCNPRRPTHWTSALRLGLLMGLAYLAKAYALPFVVAHFGLIRLIEIIKGGPPRYRWKLMGASLVTLAALALVVGAWSTALKHKFGYYMTGSSGRYNLILDAPDDPTLHEPRPHQVIFYGFLAPPNDTAISEWEDPTNDMWRLPKVDPWKSRWTREYLRTPLSEEFRRLFLNDSTTPQDRSVFQRLWDEFRSMLMSPETREPPRSEIGPFYMNYRGVLNELEWATPWCYPILLVAFLIALSRADLLPRRPGLILFAGILLYPCGYLFLHIERRFMTPLCLLVLLAAGYAIGRAAARGLLSGWWRPALAAAVVGWTFYANPTLHLLQTPNLSKDTAEVAKRLAGVLPAGIKVASDYDWGEALHLSFHLQWRFYGVPRGGEGPQQITRDLQRLGVEYYIVQGNDWPARENWTRVETPNYGGFRIYKVPPTPETAGKKS